MATIAGVSAPHPGQQCRGPPAVGPFHPNKLHSDPERFVCVYPAYINQLKSISQGRRIPKEKAVENPNYQDIKIALDESGYQIGVNYIMEGKFYPREKSREPLYRGRFKIQLKQADGELLKEEVPSRQALMELIAQKIPQLKHRVNPPKGGGPGSEQSHQQGQGGAKPKQGKKKR